MKATAKNTREITYKSADELYSADFSTGILTRRDTGLKAGYVGTNGSSRYRTEVPGDSGKAWMIHRVLWVLFNKTEIPKGFSVSHINKNPLDNRMKNLAIASPSGTVRYKQLAQPALDFNLLLHQAQSKLSVPLPYSNIDRYKDTVLESNKILNIG